MFRVEGLGLKVQGCALRFKVAALAGVHMCRSGSVTAIYFSPGPNPAIVVWMLYIGTQIELP